MVRFLLVGAYWAITRLTVGAVLLVTCLHFVLNSGPFPGTLTNLLKSVLPGTIEFSTLHISPIPWKVDILDVHISTPEGEEVITAGKVHVIMELAPLVRWVMGESGDLLEVAFRSARLEDYSCSITFDEEGELKFLRAFVWPPEPEPDPATPGKGSGPKVRLRFSQILAERGTFFMSFPEWDMEIQGISLETALMVRESGGGVLIRTPDLTFTGGVGHIRAAPGVAAVPRVVQLRAGRVRGFFFDKDWFRIAKANIALGGLDLETAGMLAFPRGEPLLYNATADISFHGDSPPVNTASIGTVHGPFRLQVKGRGDDRDPRFQARVTSPGLTFMGLPLGAVDAALEGGRDASGAYAFVASSLTAQPGGGEVSVSQLSLHPFGKKNDGHPVGEVNIEGKGIDLAGVLQSLGIPSPDRSIPVPRHLGGKIRALLSLGSEEDPDTSLDVSARLSGTLDSRSLMDGKDVSVSLKAGFRFGDGGPAIWVRDLSLRSGRDRIKGLGRLDLSTLTFTASGEVEKELGSLMGAFGSTGQGVARLRNIRASGRLDRPELSAKLSGSDLRIGEWAMDQVNAKIRLHRDDITVFDVGLKTPYGLATLGSATLGPLTAAPARMDLRVKALSVKRWNVLRFPGLRYMGFKGMGKVEVQQAELRLGRPLETLSGTGQIAFPLLGAMGKRFSRVSASLSAEKGRLEVSALDARFRKGTIGASGFVDFPSRQFDLKVQGDAIPLSAVAGTGASGSLKGNIDVTARAWGGLHDPALSGRVEATNLAVGEVHLDDLTLSARREPGGALLFSSDRFLPKILLDPASGLAWENGSFSALNLMFHFDRLTPQDIHPVIRQRTFWAQFTGSLWIHMGFGPGGTLQARLISPPDGLVVGFMDKELMVTNREKLEVVIHETQEMTVSGLALDDGSGILEVCGVVLDPDGKTKLLARGPVGLYWLRLLKDVFSVADGYVLLTGGPDGDRIHPPMGCQRHMVEGSGSVALGGTLWPVFQPELVGDITTGPVNFGIRNFAPAFQVQEGTKIVLSPSPDGRVLLDIQPENKLRGTVGDGRFALHGKVFVKGYVPNEGTLHLSGIDIRHSSAGNYFIVGNPDLVVRFDNMTESGSEHVEIAGNIQVTDGSYHRNFDMLQKAFSGVTGTRVAEEEGPPLATLAPWITGAKLNVTVTGSPFGVRTRLPFGSSELEMAIDLAVRGTVSKPEIWNRMEVQPGGKFIYNVVRREFEVLRGTLDFDGDVDRPQVDVTARTRVEYRGASIAEPRTSSRFSPDMTSDGFDDQGVIILLNISGRYPDLNLSLSSNTRDLDQNDLMYLALTGQTSLDATGGESAGFIDIGILTDDLTNLVTNLLLSPFVDAVRFGVNASGGVNAQVMAHMGSRIKFETQIMQEQGGSRYSAGFQMKLTDRFHLEGRLRAVEQSIDPSEVGRRYETKLRYRIPID